jgi:hypothetical protein
MQPGADRLIFFWQQIGRGWRTTKGILYSPAITHALQKKNRTTILFAETVISGRYGFTCFAPTVFPAQSHRQ